MKRILCLILTAALAVLMTGCKSDGDGASSQQSAAVPIPPASQGVPSGSFSLPQTTIFPTDFGSLDNIKKGWGQGHNVDAQNRPTACTEYNEKYGQYDALFVGPDDKNLYLTFDEGYENGYTSDILDTLREKKVSAMFFVTCDYVKRNPDLIRRMIDEGHVVGNHTCNHPSLPTVSVQKAQEEIQTLHDYVQENFNYTMHYLRPPKGEFSERTLAVTQSLNYKTVFWSFAYYDYDVNKQPDAQSALQKLTEARHGGAIYLLHAISKTNTEILGTLIDSLQTDGYRFAKFGL